jgi:predicted outer membrane repeat protein
MKNGVSIYGGFAGGETEVGQRNWEANPTILSGDLNGDDEPGFVNYDDNSYHVFIHQVGTNLDSSARLDGFAITGGNANSVGTASSGGGMYNYASSPTLANCTFEGNLAQYGGGMYNDENSHPTLTSVIFTGNTAGDAGPGDGGGMNNADNSQPHLANVTFSGNTATRSGGGISNGDSSPTLIDVTFSGNSAGESGGGIYNYQSSPTLTGCTFTGNSADGGGMYNASSSSPTLTNCTLWGDSSPEIQNIESAPTVTYSDVQGAELYPGTGNINADPLFLDPDSGDLHLRPGSPCIDAGSNSAPNLPGTDFEGDPRIVDGDRDGTTTVDMGVDEALWRLVYLPLVLRGY